MNSNAPDEIKSAFEEQTEMHRALLKSMQETITLLRDSLKQKDDTIKSLQQQIANLNKVIFGSRSEKTIYVDPAQKSLFPEDTPAKTRKLFIELLHSIFAEMKPCRIGIRKITEHLFLLVITR